MRNLFSRPLKDKVPAASPPPQTSISPSKDSATATAPDGDAADDPVARLAKLLKAIYYLQLVEIVGLVLISFIHNREHYREYKCMVYYNGKCVCTYVPTWQLATGHQLGHFITFSCVEGFYA